MQFFLFSFIIWITFCVDALSQNENNIWYFGDFAGLDFNSGAPVALTNSSMSTYDNCSSVSDCKGNLLFYSNGVNIWNRNHTIMPNGSGLLGSTTGGNSAFSVKKSGNNSLYYLFTLDAFAGPNGLRYSIIDLSLQGGLGDITSVKNKLLFAPSTEKITAIRHSNNTDIWIITHPWNSSKFHTYLLTESGLDTVALVSSTGSLHGGSTSNASGQMTASNNGRKIVCAIYDLQVYELFDFDNSTGVLSNPITISGYPRAWGVEFSPDESILYVTQWTYSDIIQFDISSGNQSIIINSATTIGTATGPNSLYEAGYLQIGPDGKIYLAKYESDYLGVINFPNNSGAACNFKDDGVFLSNKKSLAGLPSPLLPYPSPQLSLSPTTPTLCPGQQATLTATGATTYSWSPSIGLNVTDNDTVIASPATTTTYKAVGTNPGGCKDSLEITVSVQASAKSDFNFTSSCKTISFINNSTLATDFFWDFGEEDTSIQLNPSHVFADTGYYTVMLVAKSSECGNDTSYQNIHVSGKSKSVFSYSVDTCSYQVNFTNLNLIEKRYFWDFGDDNTDSVEFNPSHVYSDSGNYKVMLVAISPDCGNDTSYQTLNITEKIKAQFSYTIDTCTTTLNFINLSPSANTFLWNFGDSNTSNAKNPSHPYTAPGNYSVIFFINLGTPCKDSLQQNVTLDPEWLNENIFIPNVFTPNGDGYNDKFEIRSNHFCKIYSAKIFNRWGKLLIDIPDVTIPWNGSINGNIIPEGVYYIFLVQNQKTIFSETLTVIR